MRCQRNSLSFYVNRKPVFWVTPTPLPRVRTVALASPGTLGHSGGNPSLVSHSDSAAAGRRGEVCPPRRVRKGWLSTLSRRHLCSNPLSGILGLACSLWSPVQTPPVRFKSTSLFLRRVHYPHPERVCEAVWPACLAFEGLTVRGHCEGMWGGVRDVRGCERCEGMWEMWGDVRDVRGCERREGMWEMWGDVRCEGMWGDVRDVRGCEMWGDVRDVRGC